VVGKKIEVLVPERFRPQHKGHRAAYAESPKVHRMGAGMDLKGRRRDGSEFDVEISLSPVSMGDGTIA
jgi:protein-histidine pros-kinase